MVVRGIRLENYKAFQDTGWMDILPFTTLFGYNSSGKSSIYKALMLFKANYEQMSLGNFYSALSGLNTNTGSFHDIVYNGEDERIIKFSFKLTDEYNKYRQLLLDINNPDPIKDRKAEIIYSVAFGYDEEKKQSYTKSYSIYIEGKRIYEVNYFQNDYEVVSTGSIYETPLIYEVTNVFFLRALLREKYKMDTSSEKYIAEVGPANRNLIQGIEFVVGNLMHCLMKYAEEFEYILPSRELPERLMLLSRDNYDRVGARGENTYKMLYAYTNKDKDAESEVNKWLNKFGYEYRWVMQDSNYGQFMLRDLKTNHECNLLDTGFGISQILPIIVACCQNTNGLLLLDAPEAHLHSSMQSQMCDLFIQASRKRNVIIETHSENIFLRLKRRVLERKINCNDIGLYFIQDTPEGSKCNRLNLDDKGNVSNSIPEFDEFFDQGFEDVMEMSKEYVKYNSEKG